MWTRCNDWYIVKMWKCRGLHKNTSCTCMCLLRMTSYFLLGSIDSIKKPGQKRREHLHDFSTFSFRMWLVWIYIYVQLLFLFSTFMELDRRLQRGSTKLATRPRVRSGYQWAIEQKQWSLQVYWMIEENTGKEQRNRHKVRKDKWKVKCREVGLY